MMAGMFRSRVGKLRGVVIIAALVLAIGPLLAGTCPSACETCQAQAAHCCSHDAPGSTVETCCSTDEASPFPGAVVVPHPSTPSPTVDCGKGASAPVAANGPCAGTLDVSAPGAGRHTAPYLLFSVLLM